MAKKDYQKLKSLYEPLLCDKISEIEIQFTGFKTSGTKSTITVNIDSWHIERIVEQYAKILNNRQLTILRLKENLKQKAIPQ